MRRIILLLFAVALAGVSGRIHAASPTPVILELFTSEGCSDCPPADTLLEKLITTQPVAGVEIIGLGQHVEYWDRQGWKDRFSSAALTNRQRIYQTRFNTESIYTPQMVVDGRAEFVGSDSAAAKRALERATASPHGVMTLTIDGEGDDVARAFQARERRAACPEPCRGESPAPHIGVSVAVTDLPPASGGDRADIILAVTERGLSTDVKRGENHGKILKHAPLVRYMATIGQVALDASTGSARADVSLAADWQRDHLAVVAFVQEVRGRAILASASARLK